MNIRTSRGPAPIRPGDPPRLSRVTVLVIVLGLLAAVAGVVVVVNLTRDSGAVSTAPTPTVTPSLPPDPQAATKAAVIDAYTQSFKALIVVGGQSSASPDDPRLSDHTSGPALMAKQRAITDNKARGVVIVGDAELHPTIIDLTVDSATVLECALDRTCAAWNSGRVPPSSMPVRTKAPHRLRR